MSVYLIGYILFVVVALAGVNGVMIRKRRQKAEAASGKRAGSRNPSVSVAANPSESPTRHLSGDAGDTAAQMPANSADNTATIERHDIETPEAPSEGQTLSRRQTAAAAAVPAGTGAAVTPASAVTPAVGKSESQPQTQIKTGRIMTALILGAFITILNQTLINVALPQIMSELNVTASTGQWLMTGFMLMNGVLIPISPFLIEKLGTRKLFLIAMGFFTVGALICAVAPNFSILLTGRLTQAVGAGIIMPLMMTTLMTIFPPEKRGKAMGAMGIPMMFAPALGPTLSGWLIESYNWRILFWLIIPIALFDLILAFYWMRNVTKLGNPKFDLLGLIFSTLGFGGLLYGFSEAGNKGWGSAEVVTWLAIGMVALIVFIWRELTIDEPMLQFRVFKYEIFTLTTIIGSVLNMAMFAAMILLPIYLQNIRGFSPLEAGLLMLPGALITAFIQPFAGALFDKIGARPLAIFGLIITTVTTWEFSRLSVDTTYGHILLLYIMRMFGMAFLMMTVMTAGMNQLPRKLMSHGTAMSNTMRQVAASLGTAFLVTVMTNRSTFHMANYSNVMTSDSLFQLEQVNGIGQAIAAVGGLPAQAGSGVASQVLYGMAMKQATIDGINDSFIVATGITIVALILSFFIKRVKPPQA